MTLNFPVDSNMLGFNDRFAPAYNAFPYFYPDDPTYAASGGGSRDQAIKTLALMMGGGQPQSGLMAPTANQQTAGFTQQPSIPIQSPQGSPPQQVASSNPPRLQSAPNSPALIGGSPNMALTNGGGYPMGGLPTQSPMTELYQFNQMQNAQPLINGAPSLAQMQRQQQNLQNFKQLLARLGGYSFQG